MATKKSAGTEAEDVIASFLARKGIKNSKEVTSNSWKWEVGVLKYFKVLGIPTQAPKHAGQKMDPPFTCPVKDLDSGEHKTLLCNAMLFNQFQSYPEGTLIGKCFVSMMHNIEGKNYKGFDTREVPDPDNE
jgi:hypothetical protein